MNKELQQELSKCFDGCPEASSSATGKAEVACHSFDAVAVVVVAMYFFDCVLCSFDMFAQMIQLLFLSLISALICLAFG